MFKSGSYKNNAQGNGKNAEFFRDWFGSEEMHRHWSGNFQNRKMNDTHFLNTNKFR